MDETMPVTGVLIRRRHAKARNSWCGTDVFTPAILKILQRARWRSPTDESWNWKRAGGGQTHWPFHARGRRSARRIIPVSTTRTFT